MAFRTEMWERILQFLQETFYFALARILEDHMLQMMLHIGGYPTNIIHVEHEHNAGGNHTAVATYNSGLGTHIPIRDWLLDRSTCLSQANKKNSNRLTSNNNKRVNCLKFKTMKKCIIHPFRGHGTRLCRGSDIKLAIFLVLLFEASLIHSAEGWKRRAWIFCRGGSSSQPSNYDQSGYRGHYPPPEFPPDLPPFEGEENQSSFQGQPPPHDPYSYQSDPIYGTSNDPTAPRDHPQYQAPPPLPPGYHDEEPPMGYGPPGMQDQPLYETNEESAMTDAGNDSGVDFSSFNKEYFLRGLAKIYKKKILPLELSSRFGHFNSPPLSPSDFVAPPMVLLLGQYRYVTVMLR